MTIQGPARLAGRFALVFVAALALLSALWIVAAPRYGSAVATAAGPAFRLVERSQVTVLDADGENVWIYRKVDAGRIAPFMFFDRYAFFAVVPLLALFAATPGLRLGRRATAAAGGVAALFVLHVVFVVVSVELAYSAAGLLDGGARETAQWAVRLLWEASPVLIWLAFTWRAWRRAFAALRAPTSAGSSIAQAQAAREMEKTTHVWIGREGRTL